MWQSMNNQVSFLALLLCTSGSKLQCHAGWVDPDTPEEFSSTTAYFESDTREYELVSCVTIVPLPAFYHQYYMLYACAYLL